MEHYNKVLSSKDNLRIKYVRSLHTKKGRKKYRQFMAQGFKVIETLLEHGYEPTELFCTVSQAVRAQKLSITCRQTVVSDSLMRHISTEDAPSGLIGVFNCLLHSEAKAIGFGLILARISDPGNMGAIIRCAVAMGITHIFSIESTDVWAPKVVQSSAGYIGSLNLVVCSWEYVITWARQYAIPLTALVVRNGQRPEQSLLRGSLLVIGSESHGIPEQWLIACDNRVTLPMPGNTESLNVVSAASIVMYLAAPELT